MKNHNTQECLPVPGSVTQEDTAVSGDTSDLFCAKSSSDICEANITCSQEQRGSVKAAPTKLRFDDIVESHKGKMDIIKLEERLAFLPHV